MNALHYVIPQTDLQDGVKYLIHTLASWNHGPITTLHSYIDQTASLLIHFRNLRAPSQQQLNGSYFNMKQTQIHESQQLIRWNLWNVLLQLQLVNL